MRRVMRPFSRGHVAPAFACVLLVSGCSVFSGDDSKPELTATANAVAAETSQGEGELDVRRFLGPDYCPEIRVREGTEVARSYERGHEDDPAYVVWQASIGKTARECLYDAQGNLTLKIGVSGRVIAGPKGGAQTVALPLRIAVVKHKEAVLASELYPLSVTIPAVNSTVFTEVHELTVPSPGAARDYIIYAGFDEKGENLLDPAAARIAAAPPVEEEEEEEVVQLEEERPVEPEPAQQAEPPPRQQPAERNVLPTPSDGFVLSR